MDDDFFSSLPAEDSGPRFSAGEVAILQPPHPSAKSYWGAETTIPEIFWVVDANDVMGGLRTGWSYKTDIQPPPPTDLPEHQHDRWMWSEYDLKKKYDGGDSLKFSISKINGKCSHDMEIL